MQQLSLTPQVETKICPKCKTPRPITEFYRSKYTKSGRKHRCRWCCIADQLAWCEKNRARRLASQRISKQRYIEKYPERRRLTVAIDRKRHIEKRRATEKRWRENNKDFRAAYVRSRLLAKRNLTEEQYQQMLADCGNACEICRTPFTSRPFIDHDHTTNEVRGLLCTQCNSALERIDTFAEWCDWALEYLGGNRNHRRAQIGS